VPIGMPDALKTGMGGTPGSRVVLTRKRALAGKRPLSRPFQLP
jgi:hypothetical protein